MRPKQNLIVVIAFLCLSIVSFAQEDTCPDGGWNSCTVVFLGRYLHNNPYGLWAYRYRQVALHYECYRDAPCTGGGYNCNNHCVQCRRLGINEFCISGNCDEWSTDVSTSCLGTLLTWKHVNNYCYLVDVECLDGYYDAWPANRPVAPPPVIILKPDPLAVLPHEDEEEKPDSVTVAPFHSFGDTLLYDVFVSEAAPQMAVTVILKTSTYEGRCMNYPVGSTVGDTISDLYPADTINWHLDSHWFGEDTSYFQLSRICVVGVYPFNVVVRDYAAEGILEVKNSNSGVPGQGSPIYIPKDFERWKSTADPDSDGFTVWEEYRGFECFNEAADSFFHIRTDTTIIDSLSHADLIINDQDLVFSPLLVDTLTSWTRAHLHELGTGAGLTYLIPWSNFPGFMYIDFKSKKWVSNEWAANSLCTPPGMEDLPARTSIADQGIVKVVSSSSVIGNSEDGWRSGATAQDFDTVYFDDSLLYRGPGGCARIIFYQGSIDEIMTYIGGFGTLPSSLTDTVMFIRSSRVVAHEFGHALGIDHHGDNGDGEAGHYLGRYECVLKYEPITIWQDSLSWVQWIQTAGIGMGYGVTQVGDCPYGCKDKRGLRPPRWSL